MSFNYIVQLIEQVIGGVREECCFEGKDQSGIFLAVYAFGRESNKVVDGVTQENRDK